MAVSLSLLKQLQQAACKSCLSLSYSKSCLIHKLCLFKKVPDINEMTDGSSLRQTNHMNNV